MSEQQLIAREVPRSLRLGEAIWFNAIWFQSTWFLTVLGRDSLLPVVAAMLLLHLALVRNVQRELLHLAAIACLGIATDACLSHSGVYVFANDALVPLWLCCLWLAFATTLRRSLSFLGRRPWLAAVAGAVALPLNYWAGQKLGAVQFGYPLPLTLAVVGVVWAVVFPAMYKLTALIEAAQGQEAER